MSKYGPSSAFLFVGGRDLSPLTYGFEEGVEELQHDSRGLGVSWGESTPVGVCMVTLTTEAGLYDTESTANNKAYSELGATKQLVAYGVAGGAIGDAAVMMNGDYANVYKRIANKADLTMANAEHTLSGERLEGLILHKATETADGNTESSSIDNGASSASGLAADLHVAALTLGGYTGVTITLRESTDDISFTDVASGAFSQVIGLGSERITPSGTIARYLALDWTFDGAGSSPSITFLVVAKRG